MQSDFGLRGLLSSIRYKIFASYHHRGDQWYYDNFSRLFAETYETVRDNSLDRIVESDDTDYVIRCIRENYISGTSCTFVLCGPQTRWRKYVDWEIKATLDKKHGLIGIKLPHNQCDAYGRVHKPDRVQDNLNTGYALWLSWEELHQGHDFLRELIKRATSQPSFLIDNSRPLRQRNGQEYAYSY